MAETSGPFSSYKGADKDVRGLLSFGPDRSRMLVPGSVKPIGMSRSERKARRGFCIGKQTTHTKPLSPSKVTTNGCSQYPSHYKGYGKTPSLKGQKKQVHSEKTNYLIGLTMMKPFSREKKMRESN